MTTETNSLLVARDLVKVFTGRRGATPTRAVDGVDLTIERGQTIGLVGESGSGKSTLGRLILGLTAPDSGSILFDGEPIHAMSRRKMRPLRRRLQVVFQDPYSSLNPQLTVAENIGFNLRVHGETKGLDERVGRMLSDVGLSSRQGKQYPFELSGGQRQRVNIARALVTRPELVIADEPVAALDKSIQAQVINLLQDLKAEYRLSYLFISHDLNVVDYLSDHVVVMYHGKVVESASAERIYRAPEHEYTKLLLTSIPTVEAGLERAPRDAA